MTKTPNRKSRADLEPEEPEMVQVAVNLPKPVVETIDRSAVRKGCTRAARIREILYKELNWPMAALVTLTLCSAPLGWLLGVYLATQATITGL